MKKIVTTALALSSMIIISGATSCSRKDAPQKPTQSAVGPSVLLITFDTTRADHLGPYGYAHAFTPTLSALAKVSVKFNRAFSSAPITLPSHATIMTGLHPFYHGVRDNSHFVANAELNTLAEAFKAHGYQTAAVVAAFVLDSRFGLDQGFDYYDDKVRSKSEFAAFAIPERNAAAVSDAAIEWIKSADKDRPFFLWVHYYDPHAAYHAPESFTRYSGNPYDVEIAYADSELGRLLKEVEQTTGKGKQTIIAFTADHGEALGQYGELTHAYFAYDSTLHVPLIIQLPNNSHAGEEIDTPVGLVDIFPTLLDLCGLPVPSPSDMHGRSLVPLIRSPHPPADLVERPIAFESYEPHYSHGWAPVQGIRLGEKKYIASPKPELYLLAENPREVPNANRFDDMPDLAAKMKRAYGDLFDGALSFPSLAREPQAPPPEVIEQLRALGYVGAAVPEALAEGEGKDLKDMLPAFRSIMSAMSLISNGEFSNSAKQLVVLLKKEPENPRVLWLLAELAATTPSIADIALPVLEEALREKHATPSMIPQLLVNLGRIHIGQNQNQRALDRFTEAIQVNRNYAAAFSWAGLINLRLDHPKAAVQALSRAAELFGPNVDYSRIALGWALFMDQQPDKGVEQWSAVLDKDPEADAIWSLEQDCPFDTELAGRAEPILRRYVGDESIPPRVRAALAVLHTTALSVLGRSQDALAALESAQVGIPKENPTLLLRLAGWHMILGATEEARQLLVKAHEIDPDHGKVVSALAGLLEREEKIDDAVQLLTTYHDAHPNDAEGINNLAWMLAQQGKDLDLALKLAKQAHTRPPTNAPASDTLGWVYRVRGDREMAVIMFEKATRLRPDGATYHYHLGLAYREMGRSDDARSAFTTAVELSPNPHPGWYDEAARGASRE